MNSWIRSRVLEVRARLSCHWRHPVIRSRGIWTQTHLIRGWLLLHLALRGARAAWAAWAAWAAKTAWRSLKRLFPSTGDISAWNPDLVISFLGRRQTLGARLVWFSLAFETSAACFHSFKKVSLPFHLLMRFEKNRCLCRRTGLLNVVVNYSLSLSDIRTTH